MSEKHVQRTYSLSERTAQRINDLATEKEAWPSSVVEMILSRGLDAIESGEWPLKRVPVKYEIRWLGPSQVGGK